MPLGWSVQFGSVALFDHVTAVAPDWAAWVVARLKALACQAAPFQYWPSGRWRVKVVVFAARPVPLALSAALPVKIAGTAEGTYAAPFTGAVTDAVAGAVLSIVNVVSGVESAAPPLSVACALTVYAPPVGAAKAYAQVTGPLVLAFRPHPLAEVGAHVAVLKISAALLKLDVALLQYWLSLFRLMLMPTVRVVVLLAQLAVPQMPTVAPHCVVPAAPAL